MRVLVLAMSAFEIGIAVVAFVAAFALYEAILRRVPRLRAEHPLALACPPLDALDAVASYLAGLGYRMRGYEGARRTFEHPGALFTLRAIEGGHLLRVTATGSSLLVEVLGVTRIGAQDRRAFRERIDAMAAAVEAAARALPPPELYDADGAPVVQVVRIHERTVERTVERQVVVARCKYCSALTPVDAKRCDNCGATGFC